MPAGRPVAPDVREICDTRGTRRGPPLPCEPLGTGLASTPTSSSYTACKSSTSCGRLPTVSPGSSTGSSPGTAPGRVETPRDVGLSVVDAQCSITRCDHEEEARDALPVLPSPRLPRRRLARQPTTAPPSAAAASARSAAAGSPPSRPPASRGQALAASPSRSAGPRSSPASARPARAGRSARTTSPLLAQRVEEAIRATGAAEVAAHEVGLAILGPLRELDEVAYLRFASVYQAFDSLEDFEAEIALLRAERDADRRRARRRPRPAAPPATRRGRPTSPAAPTQPLGRRRQHRRRTSTAASHGSEHHGTDRRRTRDSA